MIEIEKFIHNNKEIKIVIDENPISPREDDNLGEILYVVGSRYVLGDRAVSREEIKETSERSDVIWLPVYTYIHGGIAMNTFGFSCPWDSGQSGIIFVEKSKVLKFYNRKHLSKKLTQTAEHMLTMEIETYSQYINGEVYGYVINDNEDSCWGFYGLEYCISQAKEAAEHIYAA